MITFDAKVSERLSKKVVGLVSTSYVCLMIGHFKFNTVLLFINLDFAYIVSLLNV